DEISDADCEADLLLGLAHRLGESLARAEVAAHGDVECSGPHVLRARPALEEDERLTIGARAADPDMERGVPVAVAVHVATPLRQAGRTAVRVEHVEQLVLRVGRSNGSRPRSETLENVLECALGEELLGELVTAGADLTPDHAVVAEPVLPHPVEPR